MKEIEEHKQEAFEKAIDSLSRYKFMQFGYWSAIWVHLNQIDTQKEHNPFKPLVELSRNMQATYNKLSDALEARNETTGIQEE